MAFTISYGPSAASVGSLGALIGRGQARRENAQMQNDFARQALGVMLQDRNAQNQYNLQLAGMLNTEAARASQLQFQQQQQQFDNQLALQQMQMQGEQFEARQQLAFAELDQQKQITELKGRPQASAVWQDLTGKQQYLDQALSDGLITPEQYEPLRMDLVQQAAGFDPHKFPYEGQFEPGKEIGDVWIEERETPMGKMPLEITRDRNGRPVMTDWSKIALEAATKAHYESLKTADPKGQAAKDNLERDDERAARAAFDKQYSQIRQELFDAEDDRLNANVPTGQTRRAPQITDQQILEEIKRRDAAYNALRKAQEPPKLGGLMDWIQQPQAAPPRQPQGEAGWSDTLLRPTDPKPMPEQLPWNPNTQPNTPQDMQFLPGSSAETPLSQLRQRHAEMPDAEFAKVWTVRAPEHVRYHLETRYPPGAGVNVTDPMDLALFAELRAMKGRALRPSGIQATAK